MFDLDDFKKINDTRGHPEGDKVLMKAAALFQETLREIDTAARYGGEEFAVILPETPRTGAFVVADRIRERVASSFRRKKGGPKVTVSGGVAAFPEDASTLEELIKAADSSLYRSKASGKNKITLAKGERRRHTRLPASAKVTVQSRAGRKAAKAKNVSEGGLLVSLAQAVPVGSPVNVVIKPNEGAAMDLRGEVVRVEKAGGVKGRYDVGVRLAAEHAKAGSLLALRPAAKKSRKD
jgi:diguanylate cyclase (GGDEF)-like protein